MEKCMIVATDRNGGIGKDNGLLWRLKGDLKHFKELTMGYPVIMGYNTYLSIGRPLPGRENIVITRKDVEIDGISVAHSLDDAYFLAELTRKDRCFIIGGASIYAQAMKDVDCIYKTEVYASYDADTYFPPLENLLWNRTEISQEMTEKDGDRNITYRFYTYRKCDNRYILNVVEKVSNNPERVLTPYEKEAVYTAAVLIKQPHFTRKNVFTAEAELEYGPDDIIQDGKYNTFTLRIPGFTRNEYRKFRTPIGEEMNIYELTNRLLVLPPKSREICENMYECISHGFSKYDEGTYIIEESVEGDLRLKVRTRYGSKGISKEELDRNRNSFLVVWTMAYFEEGEL